MAKYMSGLTIADICKLELKEMNEILEKYNVNAEDKENLNGMLKEAYFQLSESYASARAMEKHIDFSKLTMKQIIDETMKEKMKFPFDVEE